MDTKENMYYNDSYVQYVFYGYVGKFSISNWYYTTAGLCIGSGD